MRFCTPATRRSCDHCDWMSVAGAGDSKLQALKTDPFFAGINWDDLRAQNAPAFAKPQHTLGMDEVQCQKACLVCRSECALVGDSVSTARAMPGFVTWLSALPSTGGPRLGDDFHVGSIACAVQQPHWQRASDCQEWHATAAAHSIAWPGESMQPLQPESGLPQRRPQQQPCARSGPGRRTTAGFDYPSRPPNRGFRGWVTRSVIQRAGWQYQHLDGCATLQTANLISSAAEPFCG